MNVFLTRAGMGHSTGENPIDDKPFPFAKVTSSEIH